VFSAFIQEFRNWESAWALDALYVIVYDIRVLAEKVLFILRHDIFSFFGSMVGLCQIFFYNFRLIKNWLPVGSLLRSWKALVPSLWKFLAPLRYVIVSVNSLSFEIKLCFQIYFGIANLKSNFVIIHPPIKRAQTIIVARISVLLSLI